MASSQSAAKNIPVHASNTSENGGLPSPYSMTPGGTIFSTTPGGTKITYDRSMLMFLRGSPHSQTPPANVPHIPGVTNTKHSPSPLANSQDKGESPNDKKDSPNDDDEGMFAME